MTKKKILYQCFNELGFSYVQIYEWAGLSLWLLLKKARRGLL